MTQENVFYKVRNGEPQYNMIDFENCRENTVQLVTRVINKFNPHNRDMLTDVAWDCFTYLYMGGLFHKYDETMAKQRTLLYASVRNYLVDKERSECRKIDQVSENSKYCEDFSFFDVVDSKVSDRIADISRYLSMLEEVQSELEAIEFSNKGKKAIVEGIGEVEYTAYMVMYLRMIGYSLVEMSRLFDISVGQVRAVYKVAIELVRASFTSTDVFVMDDLDVKEEEITSIYKVVDTAMLKHTPVESIRPTHRRKFIKLCIGLAHKRTLKSIYTELGIGDCTAGEWKVKFNNYFKEEVDVMSVLNKWLLAVK